MITEPKMTYSNKQNKQKTNKNGACGDRDMIKYFYYYVATNEMRLVSKKAFIKGEYPIIGDDTQKN